MTLPEIAERLKSLWKYVLETIFLAVKIFSPIKRDLFELRCK